MTQQDLYKRLIGVNRLVSEPARLAVLKLLSDQEGRANFRSIMLYTGLTGGNLGQHLSKLEEGELVELEKRFVRKRPETTVVLTDKGRAAFEDYLRQMRQL